MLAAIQTGWVVGWVVGALVVVIAAALLLIIIGLGRRIIGQAEEITRVLDSARERTIPMFELSKTNQAIDRILRGLARTRGEHGR